MLVGYATLTCDSMGNWNSKMPQCVVVSGTSAMKQPTWILLLLSCLVVLFRNIIVWDIHDWIVDGDRLIKYSHCVTLCVLHCVTKTLCYRLPIWMWWIVPLRLPHAGYKIVLMCGHGRPKYNYNQPARLECSNAITVLFEDKRYSTPIYRASRFTGHNPFPAEHPGKSGSECA